MSHEMPTLGVERLREGDSGSEMTNEKSFKEASGSTLNLDAEELAQREGILLDDIEAVGSSAKKLDLVEARQIIQQTLDDHQLDPNFPKHLLVRAAAALAEEVLDERKAKALVDEIKVEAALMDDSPYLEVRSVVPNVDDPTMPCSTLRAWIIGLIFTVVGTAVNTFFAARQPPIQLSTYVAQLLAYPFGKAFEKILPDKRIFGVSLNPGPFNMKEHMLITIMANVTFGGIVQVYSTDIIFVQRIPKWFNQDALASKAGYQILLTLSTQLIGFSLAGLTRRFLVYPPAMIWPTNLATIALNRSFHAPGNPVANGWRISRLRFFLIVFVVYGLLFVLPDAVWLNLSSFNWITWIAPNNAKLTIFAGQISGLGLVNPWPTFDWTIVNYLNYPLITPLFSTLSMTAGMFLSGLLLVIPIYTTNTWNTGYLPVNSNDVFDRFGEEYNVSRVLAPDFSLDPVAYEHYSPPYLAAGNAVIYACFFALYTATIVHTALHHHKEVVAGFKAAFSFMSPREQYSDVHNRLMAVYPEVPEWWFGIVLVICFAIGVAVVEAYHTGVPVWTLVFSLGLALVFIVPVGIIQAVANVSVTLNVIAELVGGYALVGKPLANMIFKAFGFITTAQAVGYAGDLKLAHYVKLPPRQVFWAQFWSSILASFVGLGVVDWQITNVSGICEADQPDKFTCPGYQTFFTAAVIWGTVGPKRLFSQGALYYPMSYGFLVGALLPIPVWFLARRYPTSPIKMIHIPAVLYGGLNWSPYNFSYMYAGLWPALFFMWYVRRRWLPWWSKYNYVLSTALSSATAVWGVLWFFSILYPEAYPMWWGNEVGQNGLDAEGTATWLPVPADGFGPAVGEFHA